MIWSTISTVALAAGGLLIAGCAAPTQEVAGPTAAQPVKGAGRYAAEYVTVSRRAGVRQPFIVIRPERPKAAVILFAGGDGNIGVSPQGIKRTGNFLIHSRFLFADRDLLVAIVDPPSDRYSLSQSRASQEHALDIKGVIAYLRDRTGLPVWLVGTSRGTVSAIKVADWLADGGGPDGVVLTATFFDRGGAPDSVQDADPARIRVPLLLVHHRNDQCLRTPFRLAAPFMEKFSKVRPIELIPFEGGGPPSGDPCEPKSYHGFPGLEPQVVGAIADWIFAHPPR